MRVNIPILALLLLAASCSPSRRIARIAARHPDAMARPCAQLYPVRVYDSTRIEIIPGETVYSYDTVTVDCDSAIRAGMRSGVKIQYVRIPCPPAEHRIDTVITERWRQVENTARVAAAEQDRDKAQATAIRLKSGRNTWRLIALILAAYSGVRIILRYWKRIALP